MKNLGYIAGEITKGKNLSENLLKYGNGMCSMYNGLGFIKMSMNYYTVLDIARDAIYTIIITSAPLLLVSLIIGLIVSIFQTVTSIQEQTLTFVPKIIAIFLTLILLGSWMMNTMVEYTVQLWSSFSQYVHR